MTIKDIEIRSGMTRANIRFYEAEGLLSPARSANGYRDYSDHDLEVLKRIRLLRSLRIPLEEIKALHNDSDDLLHTLDRHIAALNAERQDIDRSERVCRDMRADGVTYQTLDAQKYLDALDRSAEKDALSADVIPSVRSPWRRFFARMLDLLLYTALWGSFLELLAGSSAIRNSAGSGLLNTVMSLLIMVLLEPLLLRLWGATPGKWVMGLSVTDSDGGRLCYSAGLSRTLSVLWYGMGGYIPIYRLIRLWKSYKACDEDSGLPWEAETSLSLRTQKRWRAPVLACAYIIIVLGAMVLTITAAQLPRHRGDITAAEFCDNFNRLAAYHDFHFGGTLDETGKWRGVQEDPYTVYIGGWSAPPDFTITETDGSVTAVSFQFETSDPELWPDHYYRQMTIAALSYVCAENRYSALSPTQNDLMNTIKDHSYESFSFTADGFLVSCDVSYSGYVLIDSASDPYLWPEDGQEVSYRFSFKMEKL